MTQAPHARTSPTLVRRDRRTYSEPIVETPREIQGVPETLFNPYTTTPLVPATDSSSELRQWTDGSGEDNATTIREDEIENPQHPVMDMSSMWRQAIFALI